MYKRHANSTVARTSVRHLALALLGAALLTAGCVGGGGGGGSGGGGDVGSLSRGGDDSVNLSWSRPTERVDGSLLRAGDIDRYEVHFGTQSGSYTQSVSTIHTETEIDSLAPGNTYYFAVRVVDDTGLASDFSEERSTTIN